MTDQPYVVVVLAGNIPFPKHVIPVPTLDLARLIAGEAAQHGAKCIAIWHCDQECERLEGTPCATPL